MQSGWNSDVEELSHYYNNMKLAELKGGAQPSHSKPPPPTPVAGIETDPNDGADAFRLPPSIYELFETYHSNSKLLSNLQLQNTILTQQLREECGRSLMQTKPTPSD